MDGPEDHREHHPHEFPIHYLDDRRYFKGYAIPVLTSDQAAVLHRRVTADINGEYDEAKHKRHTDRWVIRLTLASTTLLTVFEAVRLALGH